MLEQKESYITQSSPCFSNGPTKSFKTKKPGYLIGCEIRDKLLLPPIEALLFLKQSISPPVFLFFIPLPLCCARSDRKEVCRTALLAHCKPLAQLRYLVYYITLKQENPQYHSQPQMISLAILSSFFKLNFTLAPPPLSPYSLASHHWTQQMERSCTPRTSFLSWRLGSPQRHHRKSQCSPDTPWPCSRTDKSCTDRGSTLGGSIVHWMSRMNRSASIHTLQ